MKSHLLYFVVATIFLNLGAARAEERQTSPQYFAGVTLGMSSIGIAGNASTQLFDYGIRAGTYIERTSASKFALAISFDRASGDSLPLNNDNYNDLNLSFVWSSLSDDFYFGPNVGISFNSFSDNTTSTGVEAGVMTGYEIPIFLAFSVAPELRYERNFSNDTLRDTIKIYVIGTIKF